MSFVLQVKSVSFMRASKRVWTFLNANRLPAFKSPASLSLRHMSSGQHGVNKNRGYLAMAVSTGVLGASAVLMYQEGYFSSQQKPNESAKQISDERTSGIVAVSNAVVKPVQEASSKSGSESGISESTVGSTSSEKEREMKKDLHEMPEEVPYLIVGAGTAAFAACRAIRARDMDAKVLVIGSENYMPYTRTPLSKELWFNENKEDSKSLKFKSWSGKERSVFYEDDVFYCSPEDLNSKPHGAIAVAAGKTVTALDVVANKVKLSDGTEIKYGKCLLATGGKPRTLNIIENASSEVKEKTTLFRNIDDYKRLDDVTQNVEAVAVVGGGFLGSELACALGKRANDTSTLKVYQTFPENGNMGNVLPQYLSEWTTDKVKGEGVDVIPNAKLEACNFIEEKNKVELSLSNGQKLLVDHIVCAVGLEPNVDLASTSGLEVDDKLGGFVVNAELEARSNVWVAGDAACFYDTKLGRRRVEHHDHAIVSGRLAGENMTGAKRPYWHQSMFWSDLGPEVGYEAIGIVDSKLPTMAVFAKATEEDTPKAQADKANTTSASQSVASQSGSLEGPAVPQESDEYGKGVVFYLRNSQVVGMVLWNIFGKMPIARKIIKDQVSEKDVPELCKLFNIHTQPELEPES